MTATPVPVNGKLDRIATAGRAAVKLRAAHDLAGLRMNHMLLGSRRARAGAHGEKARQQKPNAVL